MNVFPYDICYVFYLLGVKNEQILEIFNERMVVVGPNFVPYSIVYSTNTFYCYRHAIYSLCTSKAHCCWINESCHHRVYIVESVRVLLNEWIVITHIYNVESDRVLLIELIVSSFMSTLSSQIGCQPILEPWTMTSHFGGPLSPIANYMQDISHSTLCIKDTLQNES